MATLTNIEKDMAGLMGKATGDFTVAGYSLSLAALNKVRRRAELQHDFEFSRKLVDVTVNGATGGSLTNAVLHSDGTTPATVKSVLEVGLYDEDNNLRPVTWTTVAEGLERQRGDNRGNLGWWAARDDTRPGPIGGSRFEFTGTQVYSWPKLSTASYPLGLEVYTMQDDWSAIGSTEDIWCKYATDYLVWAACEELNYRFKVWVARTEGNLPPPSQMVAQALSAFIDWDSNFYEQFRRHSR